MDLVTDAESGCEPEEDRCVREALKAYLPYLTACLDPCDAEEAAAAFSRAFELLFYESGDGFEAAVREAVRQLLALGPEGPKGVLCDYRLFKELAVIDRSVEQLARKIKSGEFCLTRELREQVERFSRDLLALSHRIKTERPHLPAPGPRPPLRVASPTYVRRALSESSVDCDFILSGGSRRVMSLRLGRARS